MFPKKTGNLFFNNYPPSEHLGDDKTEAMRPHIHSPPNEKSCVTPSDFFEVDHLEFDSQLSFSTIRSREVCVPSPHYIEDYKYLEYRNIDNVTPLPIIPKSFKKISEEDILSDIPNQDFPRKIPVYCPYGAFRKINPSKIITPNSSDVTPPVFYRIPIQYTKKIPIFQKKIFGKNGLVFQDLVSVRNHILKHLQIRNSRLFGKSKILKKSFMKKELRYHIKSKLYIDVSQYHDLDLLPLKICQRLIEEVDLNSIFLMLTKTICYANFTNKDKLCLADHSDNFRQFNHQTKCITELRKRKVEHLKLAKTKVNQSKLTLLADRRAKFIKINLALPGIQSQDSFDKLYEDELQEEKKLKSMLTSIVVNTSKNIQRYLRYYRYSKTIQTERFNRLNISYY